MLKNMNAALLLVIMILITELMALFAQLPAWQVLNFCPQIMILKKYSYERVTTQTFEILYCWIGIKIGVYGLELHWRAW